MLVEPALIEGVERINVIVIHLQQQWTEFVQKFDPYAIEVDHSRNCYSYEGFEHLARKYLARNCRNWKIVSFTIHALVDSDVIEVFIDKSFIEKHHLNTYKLFKTVPVYNVNKISNEIGQISKVVDVVLYYKKYAKEMFFYSL